MRIRHKQRQGIELDVLLPCPGGWLARPPSTQEDANVHFYADTHYEPITEACWVDVTTACEVTVVDSLVENQPSCLRHCEPSGNINNVLYRLGPGSLPQYRLVTERLWRGDMGVYVPVDALRVQRKGE